MDFIDRLREELKIDEGCKYEVYLDHLGLPTFGIGHLITDQDPEHQMGIGTPVDAIRVNEAFEQDIQVTVDECKILFVDWSNLPEEVKLMPMTEEQVEVVNLKNNVVTYISYIQAIIIIVLLVTILIIIKVRKKYNKVKETTSTIVLNHDN